VNEMAGKKPFKAGKKPLKIGIVDTTFARVGMGGMAEDELKKSFPRLPMKIIRATVPGVKDLPVEALRLLTAGKCEIVIACGMPGRMPIDKQCAHEASLGMQMAMIKTGKHIIEVFAHEDEGKDEHDYAKLAEDRARKHAVNAVWLARFPEELSKRAGKGMRQGRAHVGAIGTE